VRGKGKGGESDPEISENSAREKKVPSFTEKGGPGVMKAEATTNGGGNYIAHETPQKKEKGTLIY